MLTVTQSLDGQYLLIKAHYFYSQRIKNIPSALWNSDGKFWQINSCYAYELDSEFYDEIYYKTPRWIIFNERKPNYESLYHIDNSVIAPYLIPPYKLYDYQEYGTRFAIDRINKHGFCIIADDVGLGKCHGKGTEILMSDGSIKKVEDIKVGENLMGDDGTPRTVLGLARGKEQMYRITLTNGDSFTCNESHILSLQVSAGNRYKKYRGGDIVNITVREYLQLPQWVKDKVLKAYKKPINDFGWKNFNGIDPYIYGLWLGDGSSDNFHFTISDDDTEIIKVIFDYADKNNLQVRIKKEKGKCSTYCLNKGSNNSLPYKELNEVHCSSCNGKHILPWYKYGSRKIRLNVLAGLLDTDGHLIDNCFEICTKFQQLRDDILFICRSLGLSVTHTIKTVNNKDYYRIYISGKTDMIPNRLQRKKASVRKQKKNPLLYNFTVEPLGVDNYYGFELTGNKLYCLGDFTVTHNTPQAISVLLDRANRGAKKILIICKKSIKSQWQEEIEKFTDLHLTYSIEKTGDTKAKRIKAYNSINKSQFGILIINYQAFLNDEKEIANLNFDFVIIDEAHVVSGHGTKTNTAIQRVVSGKPCLFLTGTPVMSKPEQAYGIISIASPKYFGSWKSFKNEFIVEQFQGNYTATIGAKNLSKLRNMIQDVMIRRTEYEVSVSLPKTIETQINCPLDGIQNTLIFEINKKREALLQEFESMMIQYNKNPNQGLYQRLQQTDAQIKGLIAATQATADDPRMFYMSTSQYLQKNFLQFIPNTYKKSSKIEKLVDIVDNIVDSGHKVIIFTKFRTSALLIQEQLKKDLKLESLLYTGKENESQRDNNINLFKNDDDYKILIATEAGAEGLNLTVAKFVINFNLPDTAAIYTQRIGRIRRVSSTFNNVIVYNLLTENSKDTERWENIERNKNLEGALISVDEAQQEALINAMKNN